MDLKQLKICFGYTFMYYVQVLSVPLVCKWKNRQYSGALQYSFSLNIKVLPVILAMPSYSN